MAKGRYQLQYLTQRGWWTGHAGTDIPDIAGYIARVNKNSRPARAVDSETGAIIGDVVPPCSICDEAHLGLKDGLCLLR